jgi:hypothetical protein
MCKLSKLKQGQTGRRPPRPGPGSGKVGAGSGSGSGKVGAGSGSGIDDTAGGELGGNPLNK